MLITITTSSGTSGFGLAKTTEVTSDSLPEPLRSQTSKRLAPTALRSLNPVAPPGSADYVVYHIMVAETGGAATQFDLPETALPDATLDLIDALLAHQP